MDISKNLALAIFGLNEKYSENDLSKSYHRLARIIHPDCGGDQNLFFLINECKEILEKNLQTSSNSFESFCENKAANHSFFYTNHWPKEKNVQKDIPLTTLYKEYDLLWQYPKYFHIKNIVSNIYISIEPIFKKSNVKHIDILLKSSFTDFYEACPNEIVFEKTILIPKDFKEYNFFKVLVQIEEKKYIFFIFKNSFKEFSSFTAFKNNGNIKFETKICLSFKTSL